MARRRWLAVAIVVTYLLAVADKWWPTPDSALYLGLGKALVLGQGYRFNGSTCTDVTPGWPVVLAGLRALFGENYWVFNLAGALCALGTLGLVYKATRLMGTGPLALAVTVCCAFSYSFLFNSQRILTDMPFALCFWAALYASLRARRHLRWLPAALLLAGAGLTVRAPGLIALGALTVGLLLDNPRSSPVRLGRRLLISGGLLLTLLAMIWGAYLLGTWATGAEPLYASVAHRLADLPWTVMVKRIAGGLAVLPALTAEMLTSQEGLWFLGVPAAAIMVVGAVTLWRSGRRMVIVTVALGVAALGIAGGGASLHVRYMLPFQPLVVYLTVAGLLRLAQAAVATWPRAFGASLPRRSVRVMVLAVIALNAPRLWRNALYYTCLSHTSRYHEVIRDGRHAEQFVLAELIRGRCAVDGRVAAPAKDVNILHYLSDRLVVAVRTEEQTAADAEQFLKRISSLPDICCVVVNTHDAQEAYYRWLQVRLADSGKWKEVYQGQRYSLFLHVTAPEPQPAHTAGSP